MYVATVLDGDGDGMMVAVIWSHDSACHIVIISDGDDSDGDDGLNILYARWDPVAHCGTHTQWVSHAVARNTVTLLHTHQHTHKLVRHYGNILSLSSRVVKLCHDLPNLLYWHPISCCVLLDHHPHGTNWQIGSKLHNVNQIHSSIHTILIRSSS
jgi:hypothetical protein